jgi:hypothetical protein
MCSSLEKFDTPANPNGFPDGIEVITPSVHNDPLLSANGNLSVVSPTLMSFEVSYDRDMVQAVPKLPAEDALPSNQWEVGAAPSSLVDNSNSNPIQTTETLHTIPCMAGSSPCKEACTGIQMQSGIRWLHKCLVLLPSHGSRLRMFYQWSR